MNVLKLNASDYELSPLPMHYSKLTQWEKECDKISNKLTNDIAKGLNCIPSVVWNLRHMILKIRYTNFDTNINNIYLAHQTLQDCIHELTAEKPIEYVNEVLSLMHLEKRKSTPSKCYRG